MTHPQPKDNPDRKLSEIDALMPLRVIRSETVISKLPIHNLAKRGRIDIHINKQSKLGAVELQWEVSYNEKYGQPRQLAYKLDTLVINRRIDEERKTGLSKIIRLGTLSDICAELDRQPSGKNMKDIRSALLQNASAFITAKLSYRDRDKRERRLEAAFSRYSIVFTGEKLPDGSMADAVYILLNAPYWDVLNHAQDRPLDYDYLKQLKPAEQRFYEILSYRMFASLVNRLPEAKLLYSEYCTFSAQQRYFDYDHFKKQMYKIHREHLARRYIGTIRYEATTDEEGRLDWQMSYTPGARAAAQFKAFGPKKFIEDNSTDAPAEHRESDGARELVRHFYEVFHQASQPDATPKEIAQAENLIAKHGPERARFIVDYAHRTADQNKYRPQTFNGILHFATAALAHYDEVKTREDANRAIERCGACNGAGILSFRKPDGDIFATHCPHDMEKIRARESREGLTRL